MQKGHQISGQLTRSAMLASVSSPSCFRELYLLWMHSIRNL